MRNMNKLMAMALLKCSMGCDAECAGDMDEKECSDTCMLTTCSNEFAACPPFKL